MGDKKLDDCFTRPGFVALWTKLPVKPLSLNVVAEMVAVTKRSCEDRIGVTDHKGYYANYVGNNYQRDAPARGALVHRSRWRGLRAERTSRRCRRHHHHICC